MCEYVGSVFHIEIFLILISTGCCSVDSDERWISGF